MWLWGVVEAQTLRKHVRFAQIIISYLTTLAWYCGIDTAVIFFKRSLHFFVIALGIFVATCPWRTMINIWNCRIFEYFDICISKAFVLFRQQKNKDLPWSHQRQLAHLQMPGSHQSSLKYRSDWLSERQSDWQDKAMIVLRSDKNAERDYLDIYPGSGRGNLLPLLTLLDTTHHSCCKLEPWFCFPCHMMLSIGSRGPTLAICWAPLELKQLREGESTKWQKKRQKENAQYECCQLPCQCIIDWFASASKYEYGSSYWEWGKWLECVVAFVNFCQNRTNQTKPR